MLKAFRKYLLSACIFLLSGHGLLHAHTSPDPVRYPEINIPQSSAQADSFTTVANNLTHMISVSSGREEENYEPKDLVAFDDNNDDDEITSFKKYPAGGHYSTSLFSTPTASYFFSDSKSISPFCKHLAYASSGRYLACRVFRI